MTRYSYVHIIHHRAVIKTRCNRPLPADHPVAETHHQFQTLAPSPQLNQTDTVQHSSVFQVAIQKGVLEIVGTIGKILNLVS